MPAKKKKTEAKQSKSMPASKKTKKPTAKKTTKTPLPPPEQNEKKQETEKDSFAGTLLLQTVPPLLLLAAVLLAICLFSPDHMGLFGGVMKKGLTGLLGGGAYLVPLLVAIVAVFFRRDSERKTAGLKMLYAPLICLLTSVLLQLWANPSNPHTLDAAALWEKGTRLLGGGLLGGALGEGIYLVFGSWGTPILALSGILILTLLLLNLTPYTIWLAFSMRLKRQREEMKQHEDRVRLAVERDAQKRYAMKRAEPMPRPEPRRQAVRQPTSSLRHSIAVPIDMPDPESVPVREPMPASEQTDEPVTEARIEPTVEPSVERIRVMTEDIPISIYGKTDREVQEPSKPMPEPADEPAKGIEKADMEEEAEDRAPWEEPEQTVGVKESLPPLRIRKKSESSILHEEADTENAIKELDSVISEDVLASFYEQQQNRPEGGEINEAGEITEVDIAPDAVSEEGEDEFALAIRRLSAMEGILPAENRIAPEKEEEPLPPYELPPVTLLKEGDDNRGADVSEELNTNATRLVDTLRSFRVRTRLVAISRGPAITRYELAPEEGVKVRSIANLVDDIALNLATTGVRIEAPIPGKSAVGVEVPNQKVELVALRDLIDAPKFMGASSLIMVALGMDVAGAPIYLDIAKMPHLLIAGTTGSGKSVSINCMLVSLLYHAKPDQVKLILIDPKKVELNIYNGLPHLLVPVVSDPKKAAGALHWAVTEMERRFEMIEAAGVRDLKHYNASIEGNPDAEFLPQIVIVIDELADLMMTSRDEVETSICRIAQKARAAGMHLIIGTQRPSVDVVTGVIKANVPSRIAFKVAGQMDSRVILDMVGAEKLIGNGDMLYAPVGCTKPIRVQGAFVSSEEVDEIVSFIKSQSRASYDASVINSIDEAAERCGNKRGVGGEDSAMGGGDEGFGENDPMLKKAIELAVESGKISTSLIQRRLSLGYGRAAKLIDRMEDMGIVGAPDGQKPRQVLITQAQYAEMVAGGFHEEF